MTSIDTGALSALKTLAQKPKALDLTQQDPEKAKAAAEVKANLQQALITAKNTKSQVANQRKAAAAGNVARIKEALKNLQKFAGADPKVLARMAKELAKELASALKEYAAAGATSSEIAQAAPSSPSSADSSAPADAAAPKDDAQPPQQATPTPTSTTNDSFVAAIPVPQEKGTTPEATPNDASNAYSKAQQTGDGIQTVRVDSTDQDRAFMQDARKVLNDLSNFIKMQKYRLKSSSDPQDVQAQKDIKDAEKFIDEGSDSLDQINSSLVLHV